MKFWPKLREGMIRAWHGLLDYDRKIPAAKRERTAKARAIERNARLEGDERRDIRAAAKAEVRAERRAVIIPEVVRPVRRESADFYPPAQQVIHVHAPAQTVIIKKSSGCSEGCALLLLAGMLAVGGCVYLGHQAGKSAVESMERREGEQKKIVGSLEMTGFDWSKEGFGNVMEATFSIRNTGSLPVKDIGIECELVAPSGTVIATNRRTIYERIEPGQTKRFEKFNMGLINHQAARATARIVKAEETAP